MVIEGKSSLCIVLVRLGLRLQRLVVCLVRDVFVLNLPG